MEASGGLTRMISDQIQSEHLLGRPRFVGVVGMVLQHWPREFFPIDARCEVDFDMQSASLGTVKGFRADQCVVRSFFESKKVVELRVVYSRVMGATPLGLRKPDLVFACTTEYRNRMFLAMGVMAGCQGVCPMSPRQVSRAIRPMGQAKRDKLC